MAQAPAPHSTPTPAPTPTATTTTHQRRSAIAPLVCWRDKQSLCNDNDNNNNNIGDIGDRCMRFRRAVYSECKQPARCVFNRLMVWSASARRR